MRLPFKRQAGGSRSRGRSPCSAGHEKPPPERVFSMRILHLSATDVAGGAARATYRLHTGLKRLGHDSRMLVGKRWSEDETVEGIVPTTELVSRIKRKLRRKKIQADFAKYLPTRPPGLEPFSDDRTEFGDSILRQLNTLLPA